MSKKKKKWIERGKNVLIAALTCSAAFLLLRGQYGELGGRPGGWLSGLYQTLSAAGGSGSENAVVLTEAVRPVRMAVTTAQGRYGVEYDDEALETLFTAAGPLLMESMALCGQAKPGTEREWRAALEHPGVYFDFLGSVPLDALSGRGEEAQVRDHAARRMLLSLERGTARLWYWNETDGIPYSCVLTETLRTQLSDLVGDQFTNDSGTFFAFERENDYMLSPFQMLTAQPETLPVYQAANPLAENSEQVERLVQNAGFNPHALYTVNGEWIVKDGTDTLRIRPDGVVTFFSSGEGGAARLPVAVSGEQATPAEAIEGARNLVDQTLGQTQGAARFYLISCTETENGGMEVRFGYLLNGAEVRLSGGSCCARVVVTGARISSFTLHYRSYTDSELDASVLPLEQAAAAMRALEPDGGELLLCYPDGGGEGPVQAKWSVRSAKP